MVQLVTDVSNLPLLVFVFIDVTSKVGRPPQRHTMPNLIMEYVSNSVNLTTLLFNDLTAELALQRSRGYQKFLVSFQQSSESPRNHSIDFRELESNHSSG